MKRKEKAQMKAILGGDLITVTQGTIPGGVILIEDGRIVDVGKDLPVPDGAEVVDAAGKVVTPGLVDAHTHLGLSEFSETTSPVTPQVRILDAVDLTSPGFDQALEGGVTSALIHPGSSNVIGGTSVAIKTAGRDVESRVLRNPAGLKMAWRKGTLASSQDVPYPVSRMGIAGVMRNAFVEAQNYLDAREQGHVAEDSVQELVAQVLRGELLARIHSFKPVGLLALLRLQDEFGFKFTVEHGFEAHLIADHLAERGIPVVYGPGPGSRRHKIFPRRGPHGAALLHHAGVKVSLQSDHPDRNITELRVFGAILLRYTDLTANDILRMLTINGAEIAGLGDRVGSLEPGKDADLVMFSGHPLKVQSKVEHVLIEGRSVWKNGQTLVKPYQAA